jgi:hypothetical protein
MLFYLELEIWAAKVRVWSKWGKRIQEIGEYI